MARIALQLYTLREECNLDFIGTLAKVSQIGYEGVELAGYWGLSASELKQHLDNFGLQVAACHVPLLSLETELDDVMEFQQTLGNRHIVCPSIPAERRQTEDDYKEVAEVLNRIGEKCTSSGFTLSYHNHDWELAKFGDRTGLHILLEHTNPMWVKVEFDVYWLQKKGQNPVEWLSRFRGRTPLVHLKDMAVDEEQSFTELGTGCVDLQAVVSEGRNSGVEWWIVEQDICQRPPLESVYLSFQYAKEYLLPLMD